MSVSISEVIEQAGYDPTHNVEDAEWLFSQFNEFDELYTKAQELLDLYDDYKYYCEDHEGEELPTFEEWRENEPQNSRRL